MITIFTTANCCYSGWLLHTYYIYTTANSGQRDVNNSGGGGGGGGGIVNNSSMYIYTTAMAGQRDVRR